MKKRKLHEEIENETSQLGLEDEHGASCLKYEIVKKRQRNGEETNVLMAKRCSMRHRSMGLRPDEEQSLLDALKPNQSLEEEMDFEYCPSTVEKLFVNDVEAQRVQEIALQKKVKLEISDISEILGYLDPAEKNLVLVRVSAASKKLTGTKISQVAAYIGKEGTFKQFVK